MAQKTGSKKVLAQIRQEKALDLRVKGWTYERIGEELGVSKQAVYQSVTKALKESAARLNTDADSVRAMELKRLYLLQERILSILPTATDTSDIQKLGTTLLKAAQRESELLGVTIKQGVDVSVANMSDEQLFEAFQKIRDKVDGVSDED